MPNIVQVISLKSETKRREHIQTMFSKLGVSYEFFDAINKQQALALCHKQGLNYQDDSLTMGELGCFMSHYLLWEKIINEDLPYMLIFEDDVIVSPNIVQFINNIDIIMQRFDVIKLETMLTKTIYDSNVVQVANFQFQKIKTEHMGLAGYVISRNVAKILIKTIQQEGIYQPIDHYLFSDFIEKKDNFDIYQITPALSIQEDILHKGKNSVLTSTLESERRDRRKQHPIKLKGHKKLKHELNRVFLQLTPNHFKSIFREMTFNRKAIIIPFDQT